MITATCLRLGAAPTGRGALRAAAAAHSLHGTRAAATGRNHERVDWQRVGELADSEIDALYNTAEATTFAPPPPLHQHQKLASDRSRWLSLTESHRAAPAAPPHRHRSEASSFNFLNRLRTAPSAEQVKALLAKLEAKKHARKVGNHRGWSWVSRLKKRRTS
jgi:hypothetical protein